MRASFKAHQELSAATTTSADRSKIIRLRRPKLTLTRWITPVCSRRPPLSVKKRTPAYGGPFFANPRPSTHDSSPERLRGIPGKTKRRTRPNQRLQPPRKPPQTLYTADERRSVLRAMKPMPPRGASPSALISHRVGRRGQHPRLLQFGSDDYDNGKKNVVIFSGDIGRYNQPILKTIHPRPPQTPTCSSANPLMAIANTDPAIQPNLAARGKSRGQARRLHSRPRPSPSDARKPLCITCASLEDQQRIRGFRLRGQAPMALSATDLIFKICEDHDLEFSRGRYNGKGDPLDVHQFHLTRRRRIETNQQRKDALHHYLRKRP